MDKPSIIVLNKIDVEGAQAHTKRFRKKFSSYPIFEISALEKGA
jgi:predicted GTPase